MRNPLTRTQTMFSFFLYLDNFLKIIYPVNSESENKDEECQLHYILMKILRLLSRFSIMQYPLLLISAHLYTLLSSFVYHFIINISIYICHVILPLMSGKENSMQYEYILIKSLLKTSITV